MARKLTTKEFIAMAMKKHKKPYDYSKVNYVNSKTKVEIICPVHGSFWQIPNHHMRGHGCNKCRKHRNLNTARFIEKAKLIHDDKYDYSKVEYENARTKIEIICPVHGSFWQVPNSHLNKCYGCKKCALDTIARNKNKETLNKIKTSAEKLNLEIIDIDPQTTYHDHVMLSCTKHGEILKRVIDLVNGSGCPKCWNESRTFTSEMIIEKAKRKHGEKYDYSKVVYKGDKHKVEIICPEHGSFWQESRNHWKLGQGCPKCGIVESKLETEILNFVRYNYSGEVIQGDRTTILSPWSDKYLELDIYLPEKKLAIEINGYQPHAFQTPMNSMYGSTTTKCIKKRFPYPPEGTKYNKRADYHQHKHRLCKEKGIRLIQIWDFMYTTHEHHYKDMILNALGCNIEVIYARKCDIVDVDRSEFLEFCERRSFHGKMSIPKKSVIKGLVYKGELVMACDYTKKTCNRMISETGVRVVGGVSRLLKYAPIGMAYFTTNDSGSIIDSLPRFEKVEYNNRRGWLIKGDKVHRDIWLNHARSKALLGDKWNEELVEPNKQWNELVRNGYYYIADSGLSKYVKVA